MKKYLSIEEKAELTLNSIEGIHMVPAPKYLYTRVSRSLKNRQSNSSDRISSFVSEPIIAMAILLPVLILDLQVVLKQMQTDYYLPDVAVQSMYQEDYELTANFYDYDTQDH